MTIKILRLDPTDDPAQPRLRATLDLAVDGITFRGFRLVDLKDGLKCCAPGRPFFERDGTKRFHDLVEFPSHVDADVQAAVLRAWRDVS